MSQLSLATRVLSPQARAGLDVARAVSALYVVAHHVIGHSDAGQLIKTLFSAGQEAVIVFFLLSGFVIYVNEESRVAKPVGYFLRRLRRIYPPILIAMAVSTVLWGLGLIQGSPSVANALATLLSLQDIDFLKPGVISDPYLGNDPLWSLSYEVAFYAAFPLVMIFWRRSPLATRWGIAAGTTLAFAGYLLFPNHFALVAAYFALWWVGAMAGRLYLLGRLSLKALEIELAGLTALTVLALVAVIGEGYEGLGYFPFLMVRHFAVGLFLALLLCTRLRSTLGRLCITVASPAANVAAVSYGLYVLHYPLLVQTGAWGTAWFVLAVMLLLVLAAFADVVVPRLLPRAPKT